MRYVIMGGARCRSNAGWFCLIFSSPLLYTSKCLHVWAGGNVLWISFRVTPCFCPLFSFLTLGLSCFHGSLLCVAFFPSCHDMPV